MSKLFCLLRFISNAGCGPAARPLGMADMRLKFVRPDDRLAPIWRQFAVGKVNYYNCYDRVIVR